MLKSRRIINKWMVISVILLLAVVWTPSQDNQMSYLSQKLMLENSLRERVTDALDKLLDDIKFVVDVAVEIEFTFMEQTETVYEIPEESIQQMPAISPIPQRSATIEGTQEKQAAPGRSSDLGLPLPGFETPEDVVRAEQEIAVPSLQEGPPAEAETATPEVAPEVVRQEPKRVAKQVQRSSMAIPVIKRQQVNIIMEDGITPEIIENVRQVVAIASRFDRARGDVISVMTASFKKRETQDAAEAIILKNIAEKIDDLERHQRDAERMTKIEQQKRTERQAVIRDSLRIQELRKQITNLQTQLDAPQISEDQREQTKALTSVRETELSNLKEQLRESNRRLQDLEMSALETSPPGFARIDNLGLYIILALFALALIILLVILLVNRRTHQKRQEMEWGYGTKIPMGPRPQPVIQQPTTQTPTQTAPPAAPPAAPSAAPPAQVATVDTSALKEEMKGIKQSVISMSVGQPDTASRVINEWLGQTKQAEESESEI